jgi:hypothetical protein
MINNILLVCLLLTLIIIVKCDVYLHNPLGSNNRCDERNNNRNNANRLFDSQNNRAGGYSVHCSRPDNINLNPINCYSMEYYIDTVIPITWTSQHNCGDNNDCNFIIQYACDDLLGEGVRNGVPQSNIGNTCTQTIPNLSDNMIDNYYNYGRHENYDYYHRCLNRPRNTELFTSNQLLKGNTAQYTRQNPNGIRYGFECPEERDYYPYWAENNWEDIVILTTDITKCDYYLNNSRYNITCDIAPNAPINRLGTGINSKGLNTFYWKLPNITKQNCVLRIRYNISTSDVLWNYTVVNNNIINNITFNNFIVQTPLGNAVKLAINTAQYGRVFQDRSYTFNIINRPDKLHDVKIHNINVQGKRGNIAQIPNAIEYDFIPNVITVNEGDYVHFQFIGSDFNAPVNDGEGRAGTDRSNVVQMLDYKSGLIITSETDLTYLELLFTDEVRTILSTLNQYVNDNEICLTFQQLINEQNNNANNINNCALLNNAEPYFNLKPVIIKTSQTNNLQTFYFMSTRNNNFSNRGQKLIINVINNNITKYTTSTAQPNTTQNPPINSSINIKIIIPICAILFILVCMLSFILLRIKYKSNTVNFTNQFNRQI